MENYTITDFISQLFQWLGQILRKAWAVMEIEVFGVPVWVLELGLAIVSAVLLALLHEVQK